MIRPDAVRYFHQPENGYRFSADSILLAGFAEFRGAAVAADLGAGCGVVGLAALEKGRAAGVGRMFFVEREPELVSCLEANLALYRPRVRTDLVSLAADWRDLGPEHFSGRLDYILVNPPYFPQRSSRPGLRPAVDAARREMFGGLADLVAALARLLAPGGRAALALPAWRREELGRLLAGHGLAVDRLEVVRRPSNNAERLVLAEAGVAAEEDSGRLSKN